MKQRVITVIMGGGRGSRLYPLTKSRCKPAVPFGGKYRLIDIPISNSLNSGYNRIYILSQFNTASLHRHIQETYKFDVFGHGFVDILSAEQTEAGDNWYQGTADSVRQNLGHFNYEDDDLFLILSGDQLYQMDLREVVAHHNKLNSDVTIASTLIPKEKASSYGVMRVGGDFSIKEFVEKPSDSALIDSLVISQNLCNSLGNLCKLDHCLASMGIYVFKASVLKKALASPGADFGKEIIPSLLGNAKLCCYVWDGYWEDIGTIRSFFDANMMLTNSVPPYNFFCPQRQTYARPHYIPPTKINNSSISQAFISEGTILSNANIKRSVIGVRSIIRDNTSLENVCMMGADSYRDLDVVNLGNGVVPLGIGRNCDIKNAIIDKNASIGDNVRLSPEGKPDGFQQGDVYVKDGILIVAKNGIIHNDTII